MRLQFTKPLSLCGSQRSLNAVAAEIKKEQQQG